MPFHVESWSQREGGRENLFLCECELRCGTLADVSKLQSSHLRRHFRHTLTVWQMKCQILPLWERSFVQDSRISAPYKDEGAAFERAAVSTISSPLSSPCVRAWEVSKTPRFSKSEAIQINVYSMYRCLYAPDWEAHNYYYCPSKVAERGGSDWGV